MVDQSKHFELAKMLRTGVSFLCAFTYSTVNNIATSAAVRAGTWCTVSPNSFLLKTFTEFLKAAGAPIVLLFVQNFSAVLLITITIIAIAVLTERHIEQQASRKSPFFPGTSPASGSSKKTES